MSGNDILLLLLSYISIWVILNFCGRSHLLDEDQFSINAITQLEIRMAKYITRFILKLYKVDIWLKKFTYRSIAY